MESASSAPPQVILPSLENKKDEGITNDTSTTESNNLQLAAVRPPRKISKPKITLKMPPIAAQVQMPSFYQTPGGITIPLTPVTGLSPNYPINFFQAYPNKAQEFMFKQFEGFKDFTKNTGKLGLNFGEKFAFWMYGKVRELSQNGFTHIFLFLVMCLYCALGGLLFFVIENDHQKGIRSKDLEHENQLARNITKNIAWIFRSMNPNLIYDESTQAKILAQVNRTNIYFREHYDIHNQNWDVLNWVYFCGTIFTTIVMASEPPTSTCSNDFAVAVGGAAATAVGDQVVVSFSTQSSSKASSSKIRRSKSDKRVIECTDTSDEDANAERDSKKRRSRKPPSQHGSSSTLRQEKSGYSSSEETSSSDFHQRQDNADHSPRTGQVIDDVMDNTNLRRRKPIHSNRENNDTGNLAETAVIATSAALDEHSDLPTRSNQMVPSPSNRHSGTDDTEWEMVDKYPKESDISLTDDCQESTEDDFWKSDSQRTPLIAQIKEKSTKKRKNASTKVKSPNFFRRFLNEWIDFKQDNQQALYQLKLCSNSCFVSFLLVFIYCGIGGIIFHTTEGAFEMFYKCGVKRVKRDFLDTLWSKSNYMREDEWKSTARNKLMEFENQLYDAYEAGMNSYSGQRGWSFINSLVYCVTLVTTIGYGHIAPKTMVGRIITIVYALFGVPMFLIMLADYGKLLTRGIKFLWAFVRRLYYTGSCRKVRRTAPVQEVVKGVQLVFDMTKLRRPSTIAKEGGEPTFPCPTSPTGTPALSSYTIDDEFNLPVSVAFSILVLYMLAGAVIISYFEDWTVFESFYFVYISILTIGLGDLVLTSKGFLFCLLYLIFGLALTSMCINVVQEKLSDSFRQATAKIGATMGLEVTEDLVLNVPVMNQTQTTES